MLCEHLHVVENALLEAGIRLLFRGQAWSRQCREWVYFDCYLDTGRLRRMFELPAFVIDHSHRGTHDGQEHGLVCEQCQDGVMGLLDPITGKPRFPSVNPTSPCMREVP